MLGFLIGGLLLFPIAHTYGRLVQQHSGRRGRNRVHRSG